MTDRSNYGPVRRPSPMSADSRKPYSRTGLKGVLGTLDLNSGDTAVPTPPDSPYYPFHVETPQLEAPTQNRPSVPDGPRDIPGFPSYEQYQRIEEEYLTSLSERKQPKALISQALFDKIFAVLQNGSEDRASTAQFRFWVRKMFVLAYPQTSFNHNSGQTPESVVLHDKRPVAIKEQLYEVLCYCHAVARHGGRDKTCATLRLNYSWVPKELTAKFVKACPTCTLKRSGNPDLLSQFGQTVASPYAPPNVPTESASLFSGGPNDSPPGLSFIIGSAGCDDGSSCVGGFCPSIFATPDLSVYPSPTLSVGSLGPTTPSPYLPSGLFGYPAMFDPGHHGSLSSVATMWDPSPFSPCMTMYAEELRATGSAKQQQQQQQQQQHPVASVDEIIDMRARGMQLHLPTPKAARPMRTRVHSNGNADSDGRSADPFPCIVGTPCPADANNIDPTLLMETGYPTPLALVSPAHVAAGGGEADAAGDSYLLGIVATWEASMGMGMGSVSSSSTGASHCYQMPESTSTPGRSLRLAPPPPCASCPASHAAAGPSMVMMMMASPPMPPPPAAASSAPDSDALEMGVQAQAQTQQKRRCVVMRCGCVAQQEASEDGTTEMDETVLLSTEIMKTEDADVEEGLVLPRQRPLLEDAGWDSPEAWLVQSDSFDGVE